MSVNLQELLYSSKGTDIVLLPSGGSALVKEMTGQEQRNFTNRTKMFNGAALQELIAACTESYKGQDLPVDKQERIKFVTGLLSGDRNALMFGIRRFSLGDSFSFRTECPVCEQKGEWEVDLSDKSAFTTTPYKYGEEKTAQYESKVRPGLKIRFKHLDGYAELAILKMRADIDSLTDLEVRCPEASEVSSEEWVRVQLNKLPDSFIAEMRKEIRSCEGGVDSSVKVTCGNCSSTVTFDLLKQPDFMIPSVTS